MIIYKVTNKVNGKIYIGQTTRCLKERQLEHFHDAKRKDRPTVYFHNAINKYGKENFIFEKIDDANTIEELNKKEEYWIKYYNSTNKSIGYNLDSGGKNCKKSESTKLKIGKSSKANWENPEIREKMLLGLKKGTTTIKNRPKNLIEKRCIICGKKMLLLPWEAKKRKCCSSKCVAVFNSMDTLASHKKSESHLKIAEPIHKERIYKTELWCKNNKNIIKNCPYNKITTNLKPLLETLQIKDIRTLMSDYHVKNRKELLNVLKTYI